MIPAEALEAPPSNELLAKIASARSLLADLVDTKKRREAKQARYLRGPKPLILDCQAGEQFFCVIARTKVPVSRVTGQVKF